MSMIMYKMMTILKTFSRMLLLLSITTCGGPSTNSSDSRPTESELSKRQTNSEKQQSYDPLETGWFNGTPEAEKEAWRHFIAEGKYRIAQPSDFKIPDAAKRVLGVEPSSNSIEATKQPYVGGDINRDGAFNDFAAIVVDKTKTDALRFGLVIFNQPKDSTSPYTFHWLHSGQDLSRTILRWWSGGLLLVEYQDDGSGNLCYVTWNQRAQIYSCEKASK